MNNRYLIPLAFVLSIPVFVLSQEAFPITRITFSEAQEGFAHWSPDGKELLYSNTDRYDTTGQMGLWVYSLQEGTHRQVYQGMAEHPQWSPDGKYIVFDAEQGSDIHLIPAAGGEPVDIIPDTIQVFKGGLPAWSHDGKCVAFVEGGTRRLWAMNIKTSEMKMLYQSQDRLPLPCCWTHDDDGVIVGMMEPGKHVMEMWLVSAEGDAPRQIIPEKEGFYRYADLSPDGKWLAFAAIDGNDLNLFVMPFAGGTPTRLTSEPRFNENPRWSPDGSKIAFTSTRSGNFDIWVMDVATLYK